MNAPRTPALAAPSLDALAWSHGFGQLPPAFYPRLQPSPLPDPYLVAASDAAAQAIGLDPAALAAHPTVAALAADHVCRGALSPWRRLSRPYDDQPENAAYAQLPPDWAGNLHLSCSS